MSRFTKPKMSPRARRAVTVIRRLVRLPLYLAAAAIGAAAILIGVGNGLISSDRGVPYRALDPRSDACGPGGEDAWDILARRTGARTPTGGVGNDEWAAIDLEGEPARQRLTCAIQRHAIPGYEAPDGSRRTLSYDLAFLEFQENGKPYALRERCPDGGGPSDCVSDDRYGRVRKSGRSQLRGVLDRLAAHGDGPPRPHYVVVFVHGWRHNADIGDSNVGDFRHYLAHAARFIEDRYAAGAADKPRVTGIYVGWRGARTDETWVKRRFAQVGALLDEATAFQWRDPANRTWAADHLGGLGEMIGTVSALPTLFDRKPVSEAVAPAVLTQLRAVEHALELDQVQDPTASAPARAPDRMIVFGHSLGGNMLATALRDDVVKRVLRHPARTAMPPVLGNLVVLINPAAEAEKWIDLQRAVWNRTAMSASEREPIAEYVEGHRFFPDGQGPILLSVTAARDWPPGGRTELDCAAAPVQADRPSTAAGIEAIRQESRDLARDGVAYDWATYDLFPAFKGDFRPLADLVERWGTGRDPHDDCLLAARGWRARAAVLAASMVRTFPFAQTDPRQTRTIGHLDPPRSPRIDPRHLVFPENPFGTTHELRGRDATTPDARKRSTPMGSHREREVPIDYLETITPVGACPPARNWLGKARLRERSTYPDAHGIRWTSDSAGADAPALTFSHGFRGSGLAPITRANDPFWNMRAFDTALARHDGYMLSSFICAMNQLVLDGTIDPGAPAALRPEPASSAAEAATLPAPP